MALGYDGKLYILAFDHRGSFQKKMFGIQGDPTEEETKTIADAKRLIFEGMELAVSRGVDAGATGVLVDEQFGSDIPKRAREEGLKLAMPVEKSGQDEFDFQYGADFGKHIEEFDIDFAKVLVRYNPEGDAEMNERQFSRLKELGDWLHANDRKFLFELLVPAEPAQLESVGGDTDRYDAELRPALMKQSIQDIQDFGIEVDIWKIEGVDEREDAEMLAEQTRSGEGRENVVCVLLGPRRVRRQGRSLAAPGRAGRGLRRLRDRPLDLVGRAEGLPRREPGARRRRGEGRRQLPALRQGLRRRGVGGTRLIRRATAAVALAAAALAACGDPPREPAASARIGARVVGVSDGDTIRVRLGSGRVERVRYIGIDTPETAKPDAPGECFGNRARGVQRAARPRRRGRARARCRRARPLRPPPRLRLRGSGARQRRAAPSGLRDAAHRAAECPL